MKIGILETGEVAEVLKRRHGDYPAMFQRLLGAFDPTLEFATVSVVRGEMPAGPHQADGWLITGSRHGVYDDLPWIAPLKRFVRDCIAARVPVVGICFGHQLLAEALGGRVEKSAKGWGVGVHDYHVVSRPGWMTDLPEHFSVGAMHQDQIVEKPADAHVLATSPFCEYAALAYGDPEDPTAISVQPHPEFEPGFPRRTDRHAIRRRDSASDRRTGSRITGAADPCGGLGALDRRIPASRGAVAGRGLTLHTARHTEPLRGGHRRPGPGALAAAAALSGGAPVRAVPTVVRFLP
jgi:GMP synthase-like glutamine amidotransferase